MPKATSNKDGSLISIENCYIEIPGAGEKGGGGKINFKILPDISDAKSAVYNDEPILGRSFPLKTFSHGENRTISITIHLIVDSNDAIQTNLKYIRWIESAVYTRKGNAGSPFLPPPVCKLKCGDILGKDPLCVVLRSYSIKYPTEVAYDKKTMCPYKVDIDTSWEVVYSSENLPGQEKILQG